MTDGDSPRRAREPPAGKVQGRSRLRRLLEERPEARSRIGRAVAVLLGTSLVALAALGALVIWHLLRRGRLIRERLSPPRVVRLPEPPGREANNPL
jgi:hypothetical protein